MAHERTCVAIAKPAVSIVKYWNCVCLNTRARNWSRMQFFLEHNICRSCYSMKTEVREIYTRGELVEVINTTRQSITQHFIYKNSIFCQGDMFRPYKVILRPSKKTDPTVVCFIAHNAMKQKQLLELSSWRAWGWLYKVETCRPDKIHYICV